jgi:hypothetical protein
MVLRQVQERGVRRQPERQLVQLEQFEIHQPLSPGGKEGRAQRRGHYVKAAINAAVARGKFTDIA